MLSVSQLRNVGIVDNQGEIIDYPDLSPKQRVTVIKHLLTLCNSDSVEGSHSVSLRLSIDKYLANTQSAGRTIHASFPQFILRAILLKYGQKMIDHLLLEEE